MVLSYVPYSSGTRFQHPP